MRWLTYSAAGGVPNVTGIDMAQAVQEKMQINTQHLPVEKSPEQRSIMGCNPILGPANQ